MTPFNIASLLLRCDYIEKMGTGIERIHAALKRESCPEVDISYDTMFALRFVRPTYKTIDRAPEPTREETREKTGEETREKTREKILGLIAENPQITTAQLANAVGITSSGVEWQLARLKKDGLLKRIGPKKGGHWKVVQE